MNLIFIAILIQSFILFVCEAKVSSSRTSKTKPYRPDRSTSRPSLRELEKNAMQTDDERPSFREMIRRFAKKMTTGDIYKGKGVKDNSRGGNDQFLRAAQITPDHDETVTTKTTTKSIPFVTESGSTGKLTRSSQNQNVLGVKSRSKINNRKFPDYYDDYPRDYHDRSRYSQRHHRLRNYDDYYDYGPEYESYSNSDDWENPVEYSDEYGLRNAPNRAGGGGRVWQSRRGRVQGYRNY